MPTYISEYQNYGYADTEFIEVAVPSGTDVSGYSIAHYNSGGVLVETWSLGTSTSTTHGHDVYVIDNGTPGFDTMTGQGELHSNSAIALVDDTGTVIQFLSQWGNEITAVDGPANGMTSREIGTAGSGQSYQSDDFGATYYVQNSPNSGSIPACFGPGTLISTPDGSRQVEHLVPGDRVTTLDNGDCTIAWIWQGSEPLDGAPADRTPVLIRAGALGDGLPARDLVVSPQHRMLVGSHGILERYFEQPALVPAKALVDLPKIRHKRGAKKVTWYHFAFDPHQIVFAEGCATESLLLGPMVLGGLSRQKLRDLATRFPGRQGQSYWNGPPARALAKVGQSQRQIAARRRGKPPGSAGPGRASFPLDAPFQ